MGSVPILVEFSSSVVADPHCHNRILHQAVLEEEVGDRIFTRHET